MRVSLPILMLILFVLSSCRASRYWKGQEPTLEENFNRLSSKYWSKIPRGTSDWDCHMSSDSRLYDIKKGKLILRGMKNTFLPQDTATYVTGGVYTKDKVSFSLGCWEIRAKLGNAQGAWPAIWMLAQDRKYPDGGEIDIMEHLNHDTIVYQTVHSHYTLDLGINTPPRYGTSAIHLGKYNVYAVEIHKDRVDFFVNDKKTFSYPKIATDKKGQFPFASAPHYLLIDMQLGGNWVGKVDPKQLPVEMEIDWVRFYEFKN